MPAPRPRRRLVPLLALATMAVAPIALAYVPSITSKSSKPLRWMSSNCIKVRINAAGSADIKDGKDIAAMKKAAANWQTKIDACSFLKLELLDPSGSATINFDRDGENENAIVFIEKGWQHDKLAAGITTVFFVDNPNSSTDGRILDADIEVNGQYFTYSTAGDPQKTDIENTITHELGHVMGLDHPCDDGARNPVPKDNEGNTLPSCAPVAKLPRWLTETTMFNFALPGETLKRSPEADDLKGICETYPKAKDPGSCRAVVFDGGGGGGCALGGAGDAPIDGTPLVLAGLLLALLTRRQGTAR